MKQANTAKTMEEAGPAPTLAASSQSLAPAPIPNPAAQHTRAQTAAAGGAAAADNDNTAEAPATAEGAQANAEAPSAENAILQPAAAVAPPAAPSSAAESAAVSAEDADAPDHAEAKEITAPVGPGAAGRTREPEEPTAAVGGAAATVANHNDNVNDSDTGKAVEAPAAEEDTDADDKTQAAPPSTPTQSAEAVLAEEQRPESPAQSVSRALSELIGPEDYMDRLMDFDAGGNHDNDNKFDRASGDVEVPEGSEEEEATADQKASCPLLLQLLHSTVAPAL